jgi:hypothetical protein
LTKVDKPDILSRKFKVNALQLAGDAENKISLAIEIRTLTVADTEGKGDITITASEMRTAYGSNSTPLPILVSGDYAAEGTTIRATVAPTEGYYPSGLSYTPAGGSPNSAGYVSASGNSRTYGFTMPSANTTLTAQFTEVPPISNIAYSAALGDAWVLQGDERRQSPTITDGGVTKARISFTSDVSNASITIQLDVSSELGYDYAFISELDNADATYQSGFTAGSVISGANSVTITIPIPTTGNHFIDIGYRKDGSNDVGSDCAWFKIIQ